MPFTRCPIDKMPFDKMSFDKMPFDKRPLAKCLFHKLHIIYNAKLTKYNMTICQNDH